MSMTIRARTRVESSRYRVQAWSQAGAALCLALAACGDSPTGLATPSSGGGWPVATPSSVGLAQQPLLDLKHEIAFGEYGEVHSVLIVRNGKLVYEEYFGPGQRDELQVMVTTQGNYDGLRGLGLGKLVDILERAAQSGT